jgi:hypothetical protein
MTHDSILRKLTAVLEQEITTECQVVYVLAEIRKAIERADETEKYHALDFYCSFALHTSMSKEGAKRILRRFDEAHPILVKGDKLSKELQDQLDQTMKVERFQEELERFLLEHNLPMRLFAEPETWVRFLQLYAKAIDECELVVMGDHAQLQNLDRVVIRHEEATKILRTEFGDHLVFRITWTSYGKDQTSGSQSIYFGYESPHADKQLV